MTRSRLALLLAPAMLLPVSAAIQAQAATTRAAGPAARQATYQRLAITTRSLPSAAMGQPYESRFRASGARGHVVWSAIGSLPAGLALDPATGVLSGVPTTAGSQEVLVAASLAGKRAAVGWGSAILTVESPAITNVAFSPIAHSGSSLTVHVWGAGFGVRRFGSEAQVCGTGQAGRQCADMAVTSWTDDQIVGTLAVRPGSGRGPAAEAGDHLVLRVNGARWMGPVVLTQARTVPAILAVPESALLAHVGTPYELTLPAVKTTGPGSWTVVSGGLPRGLTLDRSTGVISGIPAVAGTDRFAVRAHGAGSSSASAPITLTVSANVTVPEHTVASALYQSMYFSKLGDSPELENVLLADVATQVYATDRKASSTVVIAGLSALRSAFDGATNRLVPDTGTGLASFGPNLVPQLAGATGVMMSFARSRGAGLIGPAVEAVATSVYRRYLRTNMATALGLQVSYEGFNDRTVYDSGDVAGSAFHALVSAPAIGQAVSCGQASAACAAVVDSLLKPVTGVSVRATPAQMEAADSTLQTTLSGLGLAVNSDGTMTTSVKAFDQALTAAGNATKGFVSSAAPDVASLISMAGDPAAPTNPTATAAQSATDLTATAQQFSTALTSGSFLSGIGNAIDPSTADSSDDSLLSGDSIAQGTESLLTSLGSDNATQDTEIADTIGAFVDVCTGNFADAIKQVFGILGAATGGGSGQKQSEAFKLAQQTQQMITKVYKKLSAQLTQVQKQISQVQTTLSHLYKTMIADFAQINFKLYTISNQLAADTVRLTQLQYAVDVVDETLLDLGAWQWADQITADQNHCLDYTAQFPTLGPMPKPLYVQCAGDFVTDAQDTWDPALELPVPNVPSPYSNATIGAQLGGGYDPAKELLYYLSILHSRGDAAAPPAQLVNPDAWAQVALDYRELLDENTQYSAGPEPDLAAVEAPGQQIADAIGALQQVSAGQNKVINDVTANYSTALATIVSDIATRQSAFPSTNTPAAYQPPDGTSWFGYNAFDPAGAQQAIPSNDDPQQSISSLAECGSTVTVSIAPAPWENDAGNATNPLVNPPNSWYLLYHLVGYADPALAPTATPLCYTYTFNVTNRFCNPKTGLCTWDDVESGTLTDQFEGTDGALHALATVSTPELVVGCATGQTCDNNPGDYFNSEIGTAGGLVQYLSNIGLTKATPDVSVLESEGDQILAAEQRPVYHWDADGFNPGATYPDPQLTSDMQALDGAFILLQLTAQTIAPSASLGNQAVSDILYGQDKLASTATGLNNPVAVLQGLENGTSTTTVAQWQTAQDSWLTEAQGLLNGYLASAATGSGPGSVPTAEGPDLVLSVLAQLNSGKLLDVDSVQVKSPGKQRTVVGKAVRLKLSAKSRAGAKIARWSATGLPPGLRLSSTTGLITGKPTKKGTYQVHVTATDALRTTGKATFTWAIVAG